MDGQTIKEAFLDSLESLRELSDIQFDPLSCLSRDPSEIVRY